MNKALQAIKKKAPQKTDFELFMDGLRSGKYEGAAYKLLLTFTPEQRFTVLLDIFKKSHFRAYTKAMSEVVTQGELYLQTKDSKILEELKLKFPGDTSGFFYLFESCVHAILGTLTGADGFYMLSTLGFSLNIAPTSNSSEESEFFKNICITLAKYKWPDKAGVLEVLYGQT